MKNNTQSYSYIIMIQDNNGNKYLKVGKTNNISKRKYQYKVDGYTILDVVKIYTFKHEQQALKFENCLRDYFIIKYNGDNFVRFDRFLKGYASKKDLAKIWRLYKDYYCDLYNSPLC